MVVPTKCIFPTIPDPVMENLPLFGIASLQKTRLPSFLGNSMVSVHLAIPIRSASNSPVYMDDLSRTCHKLPRNSWKFQRSHGLPWTVEFVDDQSFLSGNQTWQWKIPHVYIHFPSKPPFTGDFQCLITREYTLSGQITIFH